VKNPALAAGLSFIFSVRLAPQETRTYFVTAQRRSLFQVADNAELLQRTILEYRNLNLLTSVSI